MAEANGTQNVGNDLDADVIHAKLVARSLQDERLYPLLPLLGVEKEKRPAMRDIGPDGKIADSPKYPRPKIIVKTVPISFSTSGGDLPQLEAWEVQEIVDPKTFKNWVATVKYEPSHTFLVRTVRAVQAIVKWAGITGKKIRMAGFRHTWSPMFNTSEDIVVTFIPPELCSELPYEDPPIDWYTELQGVTIVPSVNGVKPPDNHIFAKVMAGTTNNQFRQWCHKNGSHALPFNTVVLAVTFGGTNATICHGAGLSTSTLSDLVLEVCYIDAHGREQTVNDPQELRAASGCFGFMGIITSITIQMEPMTVAEMRPTQVPIVLAIPPPKDFPIPEIIQKQTREANITEEDIENARREWIRRCEEDHFHEWFWFPYQKNAWVNTWKRRAWKPEDADLPQFPTFGIQNYEESQSYGDMAVLISESTWLSGPEQAYAFGLACLASLPNISAGQPSITTYISEGIHFRGGTQTFPFWGMEWELPVRHIDGKRDYAAIQRAWWDGIASIYSRPDAPCRAALEMRLTGGSSTILAPQRHNQSTASIEVFTHLTTPPDVWKSFRQTVVDRWTSYKDESGVYFNARPHWAKQWWDLQVHGHPINEYLRSSAYKEAFAEFKQVLGQILERRGSTIEETRGRFDTQLMGQLIF